MSDVFTRGSIIDERYEVERLLGGGGMGEVLLVRHLQLGDQRVVKILRHDLIGDRAADEHFLRETRIAKRIKHANVAVLYDCSRLPEGSSYMVWEYSEGEDLQTRLRHEPRLEVGTAIDITIQTLKGLAAVHGAGVAHRDIRPDNLLLTTDTSGKLRVKIIDLGLAWLYKSGDFSKLESAASVASKLAYSSPEQANVEGGRSPDHRSDLYSLGLVLYEMLSGTLPFEGSSPQGVFLKRLHAEPIPLLERVPEMEFAEQLDAILRQALERQPEARYANAVSFIQALAEVPGVDESSAEGVDAAVAEAAGWEGNRLVQAVGLFERYLQENKPQLARMTLDTIEEMAPEHPRLDELRGQLDDLQRSAVDRERVKYVADSGRKALVEGDLRQAERWLEMLGDMAPESTERRELAAELERWREEAVRDERIEAHRERLELLLAAGDWEKAERELDALSDLGVTRVTLQNYGQQLDTGREQEEETTRLEAFENEFRACCERTEWEAALAVARRLAASDLAPSRARAMSREVHERREEDRKKRAVRQGVEQLEAFLAAGDARGARTALRILVGLDPDFEGRGELEMRVKEIVGE
jgi:tRNA A-37 threonylcarbamoyl transferase component Bud32